MNKATINHQEAQDSIWLAIDALRSESTSGEENYETILDLLLWAALIPTTKDSLIGYFDAMQSISDDAIWRKIKSAINKDCKREKDEKSGQNEMAPSVIEKLRGILLPLARVVTGGSNEERKIITEALLQSREKLIGRASYFGCSYAMGQLWKEICKSKTKKDIACLFPTGASASIYLIEDHQVLTHTANQSQRYWIKGLATLLGQAIKPLNPKGGWPVSIACPPFGAKTKEQATSDSS